MGRWDRVGNGTTTLEKGLALLALIVRDSGRSRLHAIADELDIAHSTARRLATSLERKAFITKVGHGRYAAGRALSALTSYADPRDTLVAAMRPPLRRIARDLKATVHLGILEADMVTYLIKEQAGQNANFTREGGQLEAYCSGIGKVLLANLDDDAREEYLAGGPFIPLTSSTIIDPDRLRAELLEVRERGFALDRAEVAEDLYCVAVPVSSADRHVIAAASVSSTQPFHGRRLQNVLTTLRQGVGSVFPTPTTRPDD